MSRYGYTIHRSVKKLIFNLSRCETYTCVVKKNSKSCSKIYLPSGLEGKEVLVVLKHG